MDILNDLWHLILDLSKPLTAIGMVFLVYIIKDLIEENRKLRLECSSQAEAAMRHLVKLINSLTSEDKENKE